MIWILGAMLLLDQVERELEFEPPEETIRFWSEGFRSEAELRLRPVSWSQVFEL